MPIKTQTILIGLILLSQLGCAHETRRNASETQSMYDKFLKKNYKWSLDASEYKKRLAIFQKNVERIDDLNENSNGTNYGITRFADWTTEEFQRFGGLTQNTSDHEQRYQSIMDPRYWSHMRWTGEYYPQSWDWRDRRVVTPIKSQEYKCNSCWAYAVTAVVESMYAIKHRRRIDLSEYEMLDCDFTNDGCVSGSTRRAMGRGKSHGFTKRVHYDEMKRHSRDCPQQGEVFVRKLYALNPDADTIAWFVANYGPVALNVAIPESYKFYTGGIMRDSYECWSMKANHAAEVVGYGQENGIKYWIIKNSWGAWWGEEGFFRIERGSNACQIETFATSAGL